MLHDQPPMNDVPKDMLSYKVYYTDNFAATFDKDLRTARRRVIIVSAFLQLFRIEMFQPSLEACIARGVRICVFTKVPDSWDSADPKVRAKLQPFEGALKLLRCCGVHVTLRREIHEKVIIIDDSILWDGSMNILSYYRSTDRMPRMECKSLVDDTISEHRLLACGDCAKLPNGGALLPPKSFAQAIRERRKQLGWTQKDLAEKTNITVRTLSHFECGKRNLSSDSVAKLAKAVEIVFMPVPIDMSESISRMLQTAADTSGKYTQDR